MSDGKVTYEIIADTSKIDSEIGKVTATIKKESKKWDNDASDSIDNIGKTASGVSELMKSAFSGAFMSITSTITNATGDIMRAFGEWAVEAISMASSLEEVQNVVDVTFGEKGAQKIDTWAKRAGTQFGLTELQAKKYTSTLGAMMKSSGLADDEILDMSTSLAGLAADMASFYNLDFDTAFSKIRSGISGETEPLKQLGINMSVDNMNEFLKSIGSEKTFNKMTQAEQMFTRYQYLLAATADAQGDFARTSVDSYANLERQNETQAEQLKTNFGKTIMPLAKKFQQDKLNFMKLLNGDTGVVITGTKDQLTKWIEEQRNEVENARKEMDALASDYAELFDMDPEEYDTGFYKSFGEYFYETLKAQQPFAGGKQRERIDKIVSEMDKYYGKVNESEAKVADYQKQLDQLLLDVPDTEKAGAEAAQGIADGLHSKIPAIEAEVNTINSILRGLGVGASSVFSVGPVGSFATGLDYVPRDNFPAYLHEGEGILTAEENRIWQRFKNGQASHANVDYEALGGVMRDNVHAGGDVYLDGRTVGRVISDAQGRSYRNLQRSGWQQ